MIPKKKIAGIIVIILILGVVLYLFFEGEAVKQRQGGGTDLGGVVAIIITTAYHADPNTTEAEKEQASKLCASDYVQCVESLSPNDAVREKCMEALLSFREYGERINSENSVILGFNQKMLDIEIQKCSTASSIKGEVVDCLEELPDFYGLQEASEKLRACTDEIKKEYSTMNY